MGTTASGMEGTLVHSLQCLTCSPSGRTQALDKGISEEWPKNTR